MEVAIERQSAAVRPAGDIWLRLKDLAETRKRLGVTQGQLAQAAGLSLCTVQLAERSAERLDRLVGKALADAVAELERRVQRARGRIARNAGVMFSRQEEAGPKLPPESGWRPQSRLYSWTLSLLQKYDLCPRCALKLLREANGRYAPAVPDEWLPEVVEDAAEMPARTWR
jgi:transcriptional regulator with XRE-family HTH domain